MIVNNWIDGERLQWYSRGGNSGSSSSSSSSNSNSGINNISITNVIVRMVQCQSGWFEIVI